MTFTLPSDFRPPPEPPEIPFHGILRQTFERLPDKTALVDGERDLTFRGLEGRSNACGRRTGCRTADSRAPAPRIWRNLRLTGLFRRPVGGRAPPFSAGLSENGRLTFLFCDLGHAIRISPAQQRYTGTQMAPLSHAGGSHLHVFVQIVEGEPTMELIWGAVIGVAIAIFPLLAAMLVSR
ncbi:hypothetical protein ACFLQ0_00680 [Nitrospinota bacterium]